MLNTGQSCYSCGTNQMELRPYGPNAQWVCFKCGMKDLKTTEKQFSTQLEASGPIAVIGEEVGPYPFTKGRQ